MIDSSDKDWWKGKCFGAVGVFPSTYVAKLAPREKPLQVIQSVNINSLHADGIIKLLRDQVNKNMRSNHFCSPIPTITHLYQVAVISDFPLVIAFSQGINIYRPLLEKSTFIPFKLHSITITKLGGPKIEAKTLLSSFIIVVIGEQSPIPTSNLALQPDLFTSSGAN